MGIRSILFYHAFSIPLFPVGRSTEWICQTCDKDVDTNRPMRLALTGCGVATGWLVISIGALGLTVIHLKKGDIGPPAVLMMIGFALILTMLRQRRNARRAAFEKAAATVTPLAGDNCPLCGALHAPRNRSRCEHCDVAVITG